MTRDSITWFEIPARDIERAARFYEALLARTLRRESMLGTQLAVFPAADDGIAGCLLAGDDAPEPGSSTLVYLDVAPALAPALARTLAAGGRVLKDRTALPPGMGFFAHIEDSEGNRVGLHAPA